MILGLLQVLRAPAALPGAALAPLAGAPLLARQIERVSRSRRLDSLVVAVSDHHDDEQAARVAAREGVAVMRHPPGPSDAVLRRALAQNPADHVVRMTANAPFMDAAIIDATIALHLSAEADYSSTIEGPARWPRGLEIEVFKAARLNDPPSAESRARWTLAHLPGGTGDSEIRWAVEQPDDYAFAAAIYDALYSVKPAFTHDDIRALLASRPDLRTYGGARRA